MLPFNHLKTEIGFAVIAVLLVLMFAAPASAQDAALVGSWAFSPTPEKTVIQLLEDGTAHYNGMDLTWTSTDELLLLQASDGSQIPVRWEPSETGIVLYLPSFFERTAGTEGLVGSWEAAGKSQSAFIFTQDGRFLEDNTFTGTYQADEEAQQITLHYGNLFADTTVYYSFEEEYLVVYYPWPMVRQ